MWKLCTVLISASADGMDTFIMCLTWRFLNAEKKSLPPANSGWIRLTLALDKGSSKPQAVAAGDVTLWSRTRSTPTINVIIRQGTLTSLHVKLVLAVIRNQLDNCDTLHEHQQWHSLFCLFVKHHCFLSAANKFACSSSQAHAENGRPRDPASPRTSINTSKENTREKNNPANSQHQQQKPVSAGGHT